MGDYGDLPADLPDPQLGGLDEQLLELRAAAADVRRPPAERREAAREARGIRRAILVLTGKALAVGLLLRRSWRASRAPTLLAAVAVAGVSLAVLPWRGPTEVTDPDGDVVSVPSAAVSTRLSRTTSPVRPSSTPADGRSSTPTSQPAPGQLATEAPAPSRPPQEPRDPLPPLPLPTLPLPRPPTPSLPLPTLSVPPLPSVSVPGVPPPRLPWSPRAPALR